MKYFDKRIRVQIFSTSQSNYRQVEISWAKLLMYTLAAGLLLTLIVTGLVFLINSIYQDLNVQVHKQENEQLHNQISQMESRFKDISMKVKVLENNTKDMKILANLPEDEKSVKKESFADPAQDVYLAYAGNISEYDSLRIEAVIDNLEQRLDETLQLQQLIQHRFDKIEEELQHLPTIRPLARGRISDLFGKRIDPFIRKIRHHNGIDISAPRGTDVYAPAAGIVELVKKRYRLNRGYGRVIIINHGKGLKTLYGHLHKIFVKPGQRVERWEVIGQVGDTGRATGPHLHYEVWYKGRSLDPMEYILN